MKRHIFFLIILVFSLQAIQAGAVGITPVYYKDFFEPGLTKTYSFHSFAEDSPDGVDLYIKGDLAEYVTLSRTYLPEGGSFNVTISLPDTIEIPGTHEIIVGVVEARKIENAGVGGIAAVQGRIDILVPFPGEYAESTFKVSDINEGEDAAYELDIQNLGTKSLIVRTKIEIYKINSSEILIEEIISTKNMKSKEVVNIVGELKTRELVPGEYIVFAKIDWGKLTTLNQTLRVGQFLVEITDYDYQFERGRINPFRIEVENRWNTKIDEVFVEVAITDSGTLVGGFKTVSVGTNPWEVKSIIGYLDAINLDAKRYVAKMTLSYGGVKTSKLVAIYVNEPPVKTYRIYIISATIVAILIIIIFIYLIWKIRKLEHIKNGKKK